MHAAQEPQSLDIRDLTCRYGQMTALDSVSFTVQPGEFVSILGPSGCGKSTLLRAIAGLEPVAGGVIAIGGEDVQDKLPKERGVAFVFQSYALYPHMTCRENIAAPLTMGELSAFGRSRAFGWLSPAARRGRASIAARVDRIAELLQIEPYLDRRPAALSGGQRQRVALGRALIREPNLFLLDEPFANLDAALRNRTRSELRSLQKRVGATSLFVTHDQSEAMAISDRVVVMFDGRIRQIGTPDELYRAPADLTVARFLCQPHLNVIAADTLRAAIGDRTGAGEIEVAGVPLARIDGVVAIRPEHATLRPVDVPGPPGPQVTVEGLEHGGVEANVFARLDADGTPIVARIPSARMGDWPAGRRAVLNFSLADAHVFAGETVSAPLEAVA